MNKRTVLLSAALAIFGTQPLHAASLPLGNYSAVTIESSLFYDNETVGSIYGAESSFISYQSSSNPDYFSPYDPASVLFADQFPNFEMLDPGFAVAAAESFTLKVAAQHFQDPANFIDANSRFTAIRATAGLHEIFSVTGGADELRLDFKIDGGYLTYGNSFSEYYGLTWDPDPDFQFLVRSENGVRVETATYKDDMRILDYEDDRFAFIHLVSLLDRDGNPQLNDAIISFYITLTDSMADVIIESTAYTAFGTSDFLNTAELVGAVALANGTVINGAAIVGEFTGSLSKYTNYNKIPSPGTLMLLIPGLLFSILTIGNNKRRRG